MRALLALVLVLSSGCGYRWGFTPIAGARSVAVPMLDNQTDRVQLELVLTDLIRREILTRTPLKILPSDQADLLLTGRLTRFTLNVQVEDRLDNPELTTAIVEARFELVDLRTGRVWRRDASRLALAEVDPGLDPALADARDQAFRSLAERVILFLDDGWNDPEAP